MSVCVYVGGEVGRGRGGGEKDGGEGGEEREKRRGRGGKRGEYIAVLLCGKTLLKDFR